jgi:hypothetical protein
MGPIVNRGIEHLGTTDAPQIRVRRRLMAAAEQLRDEGVVPDCVDHPETFGVRAASGLLPKEEPWVEATREWVRDEVGKPVRSKGHVPAEQLQQLPVP